MAEDNEEQKALLPLDVPRTVLLKSGDHSFTYHLRRVGGGDWLHYFQGIVHQTLQAAGQREEVFESDSALLELVNDVLLCADGYSASKVNEKKDWALAVPIKHRLAIGIALRSVGASSKPDDTSTLCDLVEVKLDATWGAESGATLLYSGLVHRFRQPSIADLKRFNFEASRVKVRGTAADGVTTYPSRQAIVMKMYDDLIESVDGYSVDNKPLEGADAIKREMDGAHKAAAALELFLGGAEVTIE